MECHSQIPIKINKIVNVDVDCVDMVKLFNKFDLDTKWSCQGDENNYYYIMFQDYISDSKIECFMKNFYNEYDNTDIVGKFVKWSRFISEQLVCNWMYIVANPKLAYIDLEYMKDILK